MIRACLHNEQWNKPASSYNLVNVCLFIPHLPKLFRTTRDLFSESSTKVLTQCIQMTGVIFFPTLKTQYPLRPLLMFKSMLAYEISKMLCSKS